MRRAIFFLVTVSLFFVASTSFGQVSTFELGVGNIAPEANSSTLECTDPIVLTPNSNTTVYCNYSVSDINGFQDVTSATAMLWHTSLSSASDEAHLEKHYKQTSCVMAGGEGTVMQVSCNFSMSYIASPGEWTFRSTVLDSGGSGSTVSATDVTVQGYLALDADAQISFGSVAPNSVSTSQAAVITNMCNQGIDVLVDSSGPSMTCDKGQVPIENLHYDAEDEAYSDMCGSLSTNMDDTCSALGSSFDLSKASQVDEEPYNPFKSTYWIISIPGGVGGTCAGSMTFTAVAST